MGVIPRTACQDIHSHNLRTMVHFLVPESDERKVSSFLLLLVPPFNCLTSQHKRQIVVIAFAACIILLLQNPTTHLVFAVGLCSAKVLDIDVACKEIFYRLTALNDTRCVDMFYSAHAQPSGLASHSCCRFKSGNNKMGSYGLTRLKIRGVHHRLLNGWFSISVYHRRAKATMPKTVVVTGEKLQKTREMGHR